MTPVALLATVLIFFLVPGSSGLSGFVSGTDVGLASESGDECDDFCEKLKVRGGGEPTCGVDGDAVVSSGAAGGRFFKCV